MFRLRWGLGAILSGIAAFAAPAAAQTETAPGRAEVLDEIVLENVQGLDFGPVVAGATGGVVTINANSGAVSSVGGAIPVGSSQQRARFTMNAPAGVVLIAYLDPNVTLTRQSGTETLTATLSLSSTNGMVTTNIFGLPIGLLTTDPAQEFWVGGSLSVPASQTDGVYEGTFSLDVVFI